MWIRESVLEHASLVPSGEKTDVPDIPDDGGDT